MEILAFKLCKSKTHNSQTVTLKNEISTKLITLTSIVYWKQTILTVVYYRDIISIWKSLKLK